MGGRVDRDGRGDVARGEQLLSDEAAEGMSDHDGLGLVLTAGVDDLHIVVDDVLDSDVVEASALSRVSVTVSPSPGQPGGADTAYPRSVNRSSHGCQAVAWIHRPWMKMTELSLVLISPFADYRVVT